MKIKKGKDVKDVNAGNVRAWVKKGYEIVVEEPKVVAPKDSGKK